MNHAGSIFYIIYWFVANTWFVQIIPSHYACGHCPSIRLKVLIRGKAKKQMELCRRGFFIPRPPCIMFLTMVILLILVYGVHEITKLQAHERASTNLMLGSSQRLYNWWLLAILHCGLPHSDSIINSVSNITMNNRRGRACCRTDALDPDETQNAPLSLLRRPLW